MAQDHFPLISSEEGLGKKLSGLEIMVHLPEKIQDFPDSPSNHYSITASLLQQCFRFQHGIISVSEHRIETASLT